jgi:hypothetical protein
VAAKQGWNLRPRLWTGLALLSSTVGDGVQFVLGRRGLSNLWIGYVSTAITGILIVTALAEWQVTGRSRQTMWLALILYVIMWGTTMLFEETARFSLLAVPIHSVLVLLLSLWTLMSNALKDRPQPTYRYDWFWACLGLALLYGASSAMQPLLRILIAEGQMNDAIAVLNFKAGFQVVAMLFITAGMLCPVQAHSGFSSLPVR